MKRALLPGLFVLTGLAAALEAQTSPAAVRPPGIVIVPSLEKPKSARNLGETDMAGYLLVYFKDQTQSAYLAISRDGYTFTDLNAGQPIFDGALLAEQKGVRDPHITRGPDGAFYLAMTDLHIFGQRAGFRSTQWERPIEQYGWGNNRALVLMKSWDLIHWSHSDFRVDKAFPELGDLSASWAPETIYDPKKGKMMSISRFASAPRNAISITPTRTMGSPGWRQSRSCFSRWAESMATLPGWTTNSICTMSRMRR
jgi:hypothetical protein